MSKQLYEVGNKPPLGEVPEQMHAWLIRAERFGQPTAAFQKEVVNTPSIADDEVLVYVMAAGINYNNVWAGNGCSRQCDRRSQQGRRARRFPHRR
jgi:crotonyl-CoA carboxylase/reductase